MTGNASIRPITPADDSAMAAIIRAVMPEFGATGDGFAINDPEVDWMSRAYSEPRHAYFVLERDGNVFGGAGIAPLAGGDAVTCELRKMYFLPEARGTGAGARMMSRCLEAGAQAQAVLERIDAVVGKVVAAQLAAHPDSVIAVASGRMAMA